MSALVAPGAAPDAESPAFGHPALDPARLGARVFARLDALGAVSDTVDGLSRLTLTPAHARAVALVEGWMREAGLATRLDGTGTLIGRLEAQARPGVPALLVGSHLDTVRNAGRFDGALGVLAGIEAVAALREAGLLPPCAIEVLAFGDEEGVRFPTTLTGSRAVAGRLAADALDEADEDGVTRADALRAFGCEPAAFLAANRRREDVLAYVELHIEQGPVLEAEGRALGIVTGIAGCSRGRVRVSGEAGHAGTVPMSLRRDALAAAAAMVLAVEDEARGAPDLVATVGQLSVAAGAVNTVPGAVEFSLDVRAPEDAGRLAAVERISKRIAAIARERGVKVLVETAYDMPACACDGRLRAGLAAALEALGEAPRELPSGAGHDAMSFRGVLPSAMLFVRCKGGISHNPAEFASAADIGLGTAALARFVAVFDPAPFAA